ncbi:MAG: hypothetical protein ACYCOU_00755 [Sulfobacillus sp.]
MDEESQTVQSFTSPYNLFVRKTLSIATDKIVYWFAYSLGKINTIVWGIYDQKKNVGYIRGLCRIKDTKTLADTLKYRNNAHFIFVATLSVDRIKETIMSQVYAGQPQLLAEFKKSLELNRYDVDPRLSNSNLGKYWSKLSEKLMKLIERKAVLARQSEDECRPLETCETDRKSVFDDFRESCGQYFYGTNQLDELEEAVGQEVTMDWT